jgi:hypothetical protein
MIRRFEAWLFQPNAVRREVTVEGVHLALMAGYHRNSTVNMNLLPVHVPECRSYTVEYRLSDAGEFEVSRDARGAIVARGRSGVPQRFPVCWLPRSFAGKRADRYILMIDRKRVFYRAA